MTVDRQKLDNQLMLDEGLRLVAYKDSMGILTIGVGHNLQANPVPTDKLADYGMSSPTGPMTHDGAVAMLHDDEDVAMAQLTHLWPWWESLDDVRGRVMVDLCFNMGIQRLKGFPVFISQMSSQDFPAAADALESSLWYKQVGNRGPRLVGMVRTGEDYTA